MCLGIGLGDLGRHSVLGAEQLQEGLLVLSTAFLYQRPITEAQILKFPKHLNIEVTSGAELAQVVVAAAAVYPSAERPLADGGRSPAKQNARHKRPDALLAQALERCLDQSLLGSQLGSVGE